MLSMQAGINPMQKMSHTYLWKHLCYPIALSVVVFLSCCQVTEAQQPEDIKQIREDLETLKHDVATLGQRLQQLTDKMNTDSPLARTEPNLQSNISPIANTLAVTDIPSEGNSNASVAVVEYADFECPFCLEYKNDAYPQILASYISTGKIKYFWQDFPLRIH